MTQTRIPGTIHWFIADALNDEGDLPFGIEGVITYAYAGRWGSYPRAILPDDVVAAVEAAYARLTDDGSIVIKEDRFLFRSIIQYRVRPDRFGSIYDDWEELPPDHPAYTTALAWIATQQAREKAQPNPAPEGPVVPEGPIYPPDLLWHGND